MVEEVFTDIAQPAAAIRSAGGTMASREGRFMAHLDYSILPARVAGVDADGQEDVELIQDGGLHEGVDGDGAGELEAARLEFGGDAVRKPGPR